MRKFCSINPHLAGVLESLNHQWEIQSGTDPLAPFVACLDGGDPVKGKAIFENHVFAQSDIQDRSPIVSLMPPMREILPKRDIRDVLAFLTTLR